MAEQAKHLDNRLTETSKTKTAALQEASFYRVKLAAYEASSVSEINKLERQRINDLEHKLSELVVSKSASERQVAQLTSELEQERILRDVSQENSNKSHDRSEQLQALHSQLVIDYEELLNKTRGMDVTSTDSAQQYQSLQTSHRAILAELENSKQKLESTQLVNEKYLVTLQHLQKSMDASRSKVDEVQHSWEQAKSDLEAQKTLAQDLSRELDSKLLELEHSRAKIEEMEQTLRTVQDENAALKTLNEDGISQLINATRSIPNDLSSSTKSFNDDSVRMRSLSSDVQMASQQDELASNQDLSRKKLETTVLELNEIRSRNMALEMDLMSSKSEISTLRRKMINLMSDSNKIRSQISSQDHELKEKNRMIEAAEVRTSLLKNLMSENGAIGGTTDDEHGCRSFESNVPGTFGAGGMLSASLGSGSLPVDGERLAKRVHELEVQLEERSRAHRGLEHQYEETQKEMEIAESRYREAHRKHEAAADEIASLVEEVQRLRSGGASSVSPASVEGNGKVEEELQSLQEKHRTLEQTHVKAVQYVKGTEKMLRRMKDELVKYKERTATLEAELSTLKRTELAPHSSTAEGSEMREEMKGQLQELTAQLSSLRESSRSSHIENEELQRRMLAIRQEYERDMHTHAELNQAQIEKLQADLEEVHHLNETLKADYNKLSAENNRLNELIKASKNSINRVIASDGSNNNTHKHLHSHSSNDSHDDLSTLNSSHNQPQIREIGWLKKENLELQTRCQDAEAKVRLL
jgi:chromosome segregation ATPase